MKDSRLILILPLYLLLVTGLAIAQTGGLPSGASSGSGKDTGATVFHLKYFTKGELKDMTLNKRALPVTRMYFTPEKNYEIETRIYIKRVYDFPTRDFPKLNDSHSYFEINTVNFNTEYSSNITIEFLVQNNWILINYLNPENISLYRLENGKWYELATQYTGERDNYRKYKAQTPEFSYFAIAKSGLGEKEELPLVEDEDDGIINFDVEVMNESVQEDEEYEKVFEESEDKLKTTLINWTIILAIMAIFYFIPKFMKKKR